MELSKEVQLALKSTELSILDSFIKACEELDLRYFILQGTLLGAVRHKGFIPWDDDIDVGMMRGDFEIFIKEGQKLLPDELFIQTHETDHEYIQPFAKIRNSNTTFIETTASKLNINHGIYIDLFPLDYYPDKLINRMVLNTKMFFIKYRLRDLYYTPEVARLNAKKAALSVLSGIGRMFWKNPESAIIARDSAIAKIKSGKKLINHGSPWGHREILNAEWILGDTKLDFEGRVVNAPSGYREYLTHVYGDYMKLPPEEKRIPHHYADMVDTDISYKIYCAK